MAHVNVKLCGISRNEVEMKSVLYLRQWPANKWGTFFHTPHFIGYVTKDNGAAVESWEISGERLK